ncbi:holo-acyl carrier protein synthase [Nitritalea halalkaliphila LW7]|uniref:Holo-acyl carrier protein synthase n=1 Tax=Nitritalea halalkaliphila LW7 TaxID=1189621 RepID=I5CA85_9BACT|nr:4'-phosphopantetheinyl transferase superfamily protein [Nitritalea halalkaliphila]EIM78737.1 holo-acyl carrier protein synthase [Nitritalea halalkaliphila LW7]
MVILKDLSPAFTPGDYHFSIGTDIEEVDRFARLLGRKPTLIDRLFFPSEWREELPAARRAMSLAGIWCAKEAVVKAFAPFIALDIRQVEILKHPSKGYPYVVLHVDAPFARPFQLSVSISHTRTLAQAVAQLAVARSSMEVAAESPKNP